MANRSYLYASNGLKQEGGSPEQRSTVGISEWKYDIPLVYKILMSGNPRMVESSIWTDAGNIAIVADYDLGVTRLSDFLEKITLPQAQSVKEEALTFLSENRRSHFFLECGEIYDMGDEDLESQNRELFNDINNLEPQIEKAIAGLSSVTMPAAPTPQPKRGWLARVLGIAPPVPPPAAVEDPLNRVYALGLGNWSNILYFDLDGV